MDRPLIEAARKQYAEDFAYHLINGEIHENHAYIQKQLDIIADYISESDKEKIRDMYFII